MGFIGSINGKLRQFFATHAALLDGRDVYIGCSGNFTLEQILTGRAPGARLFSNDVSLYSCAMGHLLTGQPFRLRCVDDEFAFLNDYLDRGPVEKVAVLLILTTLLDFAKRNNSYRVRMWNHYLARFDQYFDQPRDDLPCVTQCSIGGKRDVYIYSNLQFPGGLIRHRINERVPKYDILMPDEEIPEGARVRIAPTDLPTINHYRNMYLSKRITPGAGGRCYLLFVDDKLFGVLMFQSYSMKLKDPSEIYMMTDFTVPSTRYRRLSKLALMVARSAEMKRILEKAEIKRYRTILTSVFTDKPVSMKYRGIFKLAKRGDNFLNYRGEFTDNTLEEVLQQWRKKHSTK